MAQQLVIATHHRHRSLVASQEAYIDSRDRRPIELFGQHQMPDRRNVMTTERQGLLYCGSQPGPAFAGS